MTSPITFSGLASGIDTQAMVDALVSIARAPIERLEDKKSDYNTQMSLLSSLSSKLSTLRSTIRTMDTQAELLSYSTQSSDTSKLAVTASTSANPGTYQVIVSSLCATERTYSDPFAAKDQTGLVGTGMLTIQVGSSGPVQVSIDDTVDTLEEVARKINDSGAEVSASVIYDGSQYRLLVTGKDTGAANAISFTEDATLALSLDDAANQAQAATDAEILMDGFTITSSSNRISGLIPGVTLDLKAPSAGQPVTITVNLDLDATEAKINKLVTDYNEVATFLHNQFAFSGEARTDTLMGDPAARAIKSRLQSVVTAAVSALQEPYNALTQIGVKSNRDGTLSLDSSALKSAMVDDLDAVCDLLTYTDDDDQTDNDGVAVRLERAIRLMLQDPDGLLDAREDGLGDRIAGIDDQIAALERNLDSYEESLRRQFLAMEQILSSLQSQSDFLARQTFGTSK